MCADISIIRNLQTQKCEFYNLNSCALRSKNEFVNFCIMTIM